MSCFENYAAGGVEKARPQLLELRKERDAVWPPAKIGMGIFSDWHDPLILNLLLQEATQMIEGHPTAAGTAPPAKN